MDEEILDLQAEGTPAIEEVDSGADIEVAELEGDGEEAETETNEEAEPEKPKKRSGIERLKRQLAETRAELELQRRTGQSAQAPASFDEAVAQEIGDPPKEDDFSSWFEYERALTAYDAEKRLVTRELKRRDAETQAHNAARRQAAYDDFLDREAEVSASIPDYHSAIEAAKDLKISETVVRALVESDKGPLLRYYLAKNPAEAKTLSAMDPIQAAMALGRLEQRLSRPTANKATKAQAPITPVKGGSGPMTDDAKIEAYMQRLYGKRGGNKR